MKYIIKEEHYSRIKILSGIFNSKMKNFNIIVLYTKKDKAIYDRLTVGKKNFSKKFEYLIKHIDLNYYEYKIIYSSNKESEVILSYYLHQE